MSTATIKLDKEQVEKLISFYSYCKKENSDNEYVMFFAQDDAIDMTITVYFPKKNKTVSSVVFQGKNAEKEAEIWNKQTTLLPLKTKKASKKINNDPEEQIGSDEVGVGDFLAPMIVVAAFGITLLVLLNKAIARLEKA